jgi:hypothetical protein
MGYKDSARKDVGIQLVEGGGGWELAIGGLALAKSTHIAQYVREPSAKY